MAVTIPAQGNTPFRKIVWFFSARRTMPAWTILVVLLIAGSVVSPFFLKADNLINVLDAAITLAIVSIGQAYLNVAGEIDLSVGSFISLIAVLSTGMMLGRNAMILPAVVSMLALGLLVGLINGLLTVKVRVPSFLVTLGMLFVLGGIALVYTPKPAGLAAPAFARVAEVNWGGIPVVVLAVAALVALSIVILRRTVYGRHLYAVGGDASVARLSGINIDRVKIATFVICGFTTALAGLYVASLTTIGDPKVGSGYELASIAAVVLGGTSLFGGRGGMVGTVAGVLIVSVLSNLLNLTNVGSFTQLIIRGAIIILVVASYSRRK